MSEALVETLHAHCRRRRHEAMSKRLLGRLSKGAMDDHDRWVVQPPPAAAPTATTATTGTTATMAHAPATHPLDRLEQWLLSQTVVGAVEVRRWPA